MEVYFGYHIFVMCMITCTHALYAVRLNVGSFYVVLRVTDTHVTVETIVSQVLPILLTSYFWMG